MRYREVIWFILAVLSILTFSGCASTRPAPIIMAQAPAATLGTTRLGGTPVVAEKHPVARRANVYFNTNRPDVSAADAAMLHTIARFLRNHPSVAITLVGSCDERGTAAYNQRLGAARADNVARVLEDSGVKRGQMSVVSVGELKPLALCHAERCWRVNRRVDVIYGW